MLGSLPGRTNRSGPNNASQLPRWYTPHRTAHHAPRQPAVPVLGSVHVGSVWSVARVRAAPRASKVQSGGPAGSSGRQPGPCCRAEAPRVGRTPLQPNRPRAGAPPTHAASQRQVRRRSPTSRSGRAGTAGAGGGGGGDLWGALLREALGKDGGATLVQRARRAGLQGGNIELGPVLAPVHSGARPPAEQMQLVGAVPVEHGMPVHPERSLLVHLAKAVEVELPYQRLEPSMAEKSREHLAL